MDDVDIRNSSLSLILLLLGHRILSAPVVLYV